MTALAGLSPNDPSPFVRPVPSTGIVGYENAINRGSLQALQALEGSTNQGAGRVQQGAFQGNTFDSNHSLTGVNRDAAATQRALSFLGGASDEAINTLGRGQAGALGSVNTAADRALGAVAHGVNQAGQTVSPYMRGGGGAQMMQAALAGSLGPDAQRQAYENFQSSPGQQYLIDESERALMRNAAATGGTQNGNVLQALQGNAIGLAAQDFQNNFNRLGAVADRGYNAANFLGGIQSGAGLQSAGILENAGGRAADIYGNTANQQANVLQTGGVNAANVLSGLGARTGTLYSSLAGRGGDRLSGAGSQIGSMYGNTGVNAANLLAGTGQAIGSNRMQVGRDIANSIANTTQALTATQDPTSYANLLGGAGDQLNQLIVAAQAGDANSMEQLAQLFANLASQQSGAVASLPGVPGVQEQEGILTRLLQAAGPAPT